jgi:hypothetical protein
MIYNLYIPIIFLVCYTCRLFFFAETCKLASNAGLLMISPVCRIIRLLLSGFHPACRMEPLWKAVFIGFTGLPRLP